MQKFMKFMQQIAALKKNMQLVYISSLLVMQKKARTSCLGPVYSRTEDDLVSPYTR